MDRTAAYGLLPSTYADALRLEELGADADAVAEQLAIAPDAVPSLLHLAHLKLDHVLDGDGPGPGAATGALGSPAPGPERGPCTSADRSGPPAFRPTSPKESADATH